MIDPERSSNLSGRGIPAARELVSSDLTTTPLIVEPKSGPGRTTIVFALHTEARRVSVLALESNAHTMSYTRSALPDERLDNLRTLGARCLLDRGGVVFQLSMRNLLS